MSFIAWHPEAYHGKRRRRRFFEGWYFKQVTASLAESWSFIPGIARGESEAEGYSFVQVIEGATARTWWFEYPLDAFSASTSNLEIHVAGNSFTPRGLTLDLGSGDDRFEGGLRFGPMRSLPFKFLAPGVMGPYSFIPFMECNHGLVSLDHGVDGGIEIGGRVVDFAGGRGYAEKDWGSSMPSAWVWTQSNNFDSPGDSLMLSVARVPWLGSAFTGFLCVGVLGGRLLREATWTGARILESSLEEGRARIVLGRGSHRIEIESGRERSGTLRAPVQGLLTRRISESVDATLGVRWIEAGRLRFEGRAARAGLEIVGDRAELLDR